jgi:dihydroorotate dehydrogenase electron transfer subunit
VKPVKRVRAEVLNTRRHGAYHSITIVAPEVAERVRPGQFLSIGMPEGRSFLLRRHFSIHQASRRGGWAGTLEFIFHPVGAGTSWLAEVKAHQYLDVIGPLGKAFAYPTKLSTCLLVSEGHGAAPIYFLAQELRARGKRVDMIVGGDSVDLVFKPIEGKRLSQTISIVTADGSLGDQGNVLDAFPGMLQATGAQVVYAAARRSTLRALADICLERQIPSQMAVEEHMACGIGLCFTCVVPVIRKDGSGYDNLRTCTEGPVFNPARILWDRWMGDEPRLQPTPPEGFPVIGAWPG